MKHYIYARVSTKEQNVKQQVEVLRKQLGWNDAIAFTEKCSGKTLERDEFLKLRTQVNNGDSILVLSVSRLGRNTFEVLAFIAEMKERGVSVYVYDTGMLDVCSPMGKLVLTILASVAEMGRDDILAKQRIGIDRAKAAGLYKGKVQTAKTVKSCEMAIADINNGFSKKKAAVANGISIATLYRFMKLNKQ